MNDAGLKLSDKAMAFAVRIVNLYKWLCEEKKEYVLSKQLLRSGTSIGANKECRETQYWIELLYRTDYLNEKQYLSIKEDSEEIGKFLSSITKTMKPGNN